MFDQLKKVLGFKPHAPDTQSPASVAGSESGSIMTAAQLKQIAKYAHDHGLEFAERPMQKGYTLAGMVADKPYKVERGHPSRQYITGIELRARCELGVHKDASMMVVNRHLKTALDNNAYSRFTDTMQTMVNNNLPEEVLWLTMYQEVGWPELSERFVNDYCVLAEYKDHAKAVCKPQLLQQLVAWPGHRPSTPFVLMLLRGRMYMRIQFDDDVTTLNHALKTFELACETALANARTLAF